MVMRYAPVGVFALIAVTVANFGFSSLWPLAKLVLLVHFAILFLSLIHIFFVGLALGDDGKVRALVAALGGGFWTWWFWLGVAGLGLICLLYTSHQRCTSRYRPDDNQRHI